MPKYKRVFINGHSYFLTVVTHNRIPILIENIDLLRESFKLSKAKYNYTIDAISILPDHFHLIITPKYANEYPKIISHIKRAFSYGIDKSIKDKQKLKLTSSKLKRKHSGIWQVRFYEHTIRDEQDFKTRFDYIHFNAVKHKLVSKAKDWKYSSFLKYVKLGYYSENWGNFDSSIDFE